MLYNFELNKTPTCVSNIWPAMSLVEKTDVQLKMDLDNLHMLQSGLDYKNWVTPTF